MIIFPAIDLKDGNCVRLTQGRMDSAKIYHDSPLQQAQDFIAAGTQHLHMVDLDGAFQGESVNHHAVQDILRHCPDLFVQLGGGIRTLDHIKKWLDIGLSRVILGSIAVKNPDLVCEAAALYPHKIAVGLDTINGMVAVEGWAEESDMHLLKLADYFKGSPISAFIHTDIAQDGMLSGVNIDQTLSLANHVDCAVIASGGMKDLDDVRKLKATAKIAGVITGKALYEGHVDLKDAIAIAK